jgi:hypothetical protein
LRGEKKERKQKKGKRERLWKIKCIIFAPLNPSIAVIYNMALRAVLARTIAFYGMCPWEFRWLILGQLHSTIN